MNKIIELQNKNRVINHEIAQEKQKLHDSFVVKYKSALKLCDIVVIILVLLNFTAIFTTNLMVVKERIANNQEVVLYELNPVQQQVNDYTPHPETSTLWKAVLNQFMIWLFLIFVYVVTRRMIYTEWQFTILIFVLSWYFIIMGFDTFNDLGFFIGKMWYG